MAYWKCTSAIIKDEGRLVEMSFQDESSRSSMTLQLCAETWSKIMIYKSEAEEPERRWRSVQDSLAFDLYRAIKEKLSTQEREG